MKACAIRRLQKSRTAILAALALVLVEACGSGGGSTTVQGTPSAPSSAPPVTIFAHPSPQEYVSVGAVATDAGRGYIAISKDARFNSIFFDAASEPKIRYNAAGYYEIQLPGMAYDRLVHYRALVNPSPDNNVFQPSGDVTNAAFLATRSFRLEGYNDSELASWNKVDNLSGFVAFGVPTPHGALPMTGSFTYGGSVIGMVDVTYQDHLSGGYDFTDAAGTVTLSVDFQNNVVTGSLTVDIGGAASQTYQIARMPLDAGANGFSGSFAANLPGYNQIVGLLAGPTAQEAMGSWAVPVLIDGQPHQIFGVWIAKLQ